jgi:hypothetical protein
MGGNRRAAASLLINLAYLRSLLSPFVSGFCICTTSAAAGLQGSYSEGAPGGKGARNGARGVRRGLIVGVDAAISSEELSSPLSAG